MAIITDLTYEAALAYPEPKDIYVDETGVYVYTEEHLSPRPNPVPREVEGYQAKLALLEAGLLGMVDQYITSSSDEELKIRWRYGSKLRRDSSYISAAAVALGLTDEQLDELFIRAAQK